MFKKFSLVKATIGSYEETYDLNFYIFETDEEAQIYIDRLSKFLKEFKYNHKRAGYYFDAFTWAQLDPAGIVATDENGMIDLHSDLLDENPRFTIEPISLLK